MIICNSIGSARIPAENTEAWQSQPTLLPVVRYWKWSALGLVGSGNETMEYHTVLCWIVIPLPPLTYFSSILSAVVRSRISLRAVTMCLQEAPGLLCSHKSNTSTLRRSISTGCWLSIWRSWAGWRPNFIPSWCQLATKLNSEERFLTFSDPEIWVGH